MGLLFGGRETRGRLAIDGQPLIPPRGIGVRSTAGVPVTYDRAMTLPAVWACVNLRSELISTLPVDVYATRGGVQVQIDTPTVLTQPSADADICDFLGMGQQSLDMRGNNVGVIVGKDKLGYPTQIELQHPDSVLCWYDKSGVPNYRINGAPVDKADVYHERAHRVPGQLLGLSPIAYAATSIGIALASEQFGADFFADGAHPSSVLLTDKPVDDAKAKTIKDRFMAAVRGTREPMVLGLGVKYQQIQVSPNESQFLETMRWGVQQVARIFRVPPELIGGESGNSMTYANVEQRSLQFLVYGLGPSVIRRERALSKLLPRGQFVKLNTDALLRTDLLTRYKAHAIGVAAKFLLPDEARELEDRPPLTAEEKAELAAMTVAPPNDPNGTKTGSL